MTHDADAGEPDETVDLGVVAEHVGRLATELVETAVGLGVLAVNRFQALRRSVADQRRDAP